MTNSEIKLVILLFGIFLMLCFFIYSFIPFFRKKLYRKENRQELFNWGYKENAILGVIFFITITICLIIELYIE